MPGTYIKDPTPSWLKPEQASVTDSKTTKLLRWMASVIGADSPTAQVMGLMTTAVPSAGKEGGILGAAKKWIKAYHGSPHDFEQFDLSKIGTGEGAQAYGHGLYFAENEAVAKAYRDGLTPPWLTDTNKRLSDLARTMEEDSAGSYRKFRSKAGEDAAIEYDRLLQDRADKIAAGHSDGKTYEVAIHADPDHMLDWDAGGRQQYAAAAEAKNRAAGRFPASPEGEREAIADFRKQGIPGIKYLDQGSRAADVRFNGHQWEVFNPTGQVIAKEPTRDAAERIANQRQTRNYVVFDDAIVTILKKYGLLPAAATAGVYQKYQDAEQ